MLGLVLSDTGGSWLVTGRSSRRHGLNPGLCGLRRGKSDTGIRFTQNTSGFPCEANAPCSFTYVTGATKQLAAPFNEAPIHLPLIALSNTNSDYAKRPSYSYQSFALSPYLQLTHEYLVQVYVIYRYIDNLHTKLHIIGSLLISIRGMKENFDIFFLIL
jgi:hypothetical protein